MTAPAGGQASADKIAGAGGLVGAAPKQIGMTSRTYALMQSELGPKRTTPRR